ncbi:MAG TPA: translation elongation factor Ts [Candidatus Polarisedimenticolia bacterium]|jgi:elongation factor Ts|nr:translation elongation factor Ts [Candidatus Polarisedimenticolia bacterium]
MEITASQVKELRERSGAPMMECKSALQEARGDLEAAHRILRQRGQATAAKRSAKTTSEGVVGTYIHGGGRIGVLIEVNCETDFVARTEDFQALVKDLAMHIAATDPRFIDRDEVTEQVMVEEREIYKQQAKASGKPDAVVEKIVAGKMEKFYQEFCLMEQPFVRDPNTSVKEVLHNVIAKTGENIRVRRFVRFVLGQGEMRVAQARTP